MLLETYEVHVLTNAMGCYAKALGFDSAWTSLVSSPPAESGRPDDFLDVFLEVRSLVGRCVEEARHVAEVVERIVARDESFAAVPGSLVAALEPHYPSVLEALGEADSSLASLARQGHGAMTEGRDEALSMLMGDLRNLLNGQAGEGLLPDRFLCGLAKASICAGLVTVWVPPHAHALAAVSLGATVYAAAGCGGKKEPAHKAG